MKKTTLKKDRPDIFEVKTKEELLARIKNGDDFSGVDEEQRTILGNSVKFGLKSVVKELIKRKADLEEKSGFKKLTPLEISVTTPDNEHITELLLKGGAKIDSISKDAWSWMSPKTTKMMKEFSRRQRIGVFADLLD